MPQGRVGAAESHVQVKRSIPIVCANVFAGFSADISVLVVGFLEREPIPNVVQRFDVFFVQPFFAQIIREFALVVAVFAGIEHLVDVIEPVFGHLAVQPGEIHVLTVTVDVVMATDQGSPVAGLPEPVHEGPPALWPGERLGHISAYSVLRGIAAGDDGGPGGLAEGRSGVGVREKGSLIGEGAQAGSGRADGVRPEMIGENQDNVRRRGFGHPWLRSAKCSAETVACAGPRRGAGRQLRNR